jgi:hypothetical protein
MSAPLTYASPALWAVARAFIVTFFNLFGPPEDIAAEHTLLAPARALMLSWLRAGEAMMRHLLLIEASHYPKPNTRPLLHVKRNRTRRERLFYADKPQAWRVSFRCLSLSRLRGGSVERRSRETKGDVAHSKVAGLQLDRRDRWHQARWPAPKFYSAWPLAERAEAMLRAFNAPEAYAKRLARRLHATPHRAAGLTRIPPNLPRRSTISAASVKTRSWREGASKAADA